MSQYHYAPALDQNGNPYLQLQTDQSVGFSYDQYERLSHVSFGISAGAGGGTLAYNYTYNTAGRVLSQQVSMPAVPANWYGPGLNVTASYNWDNQGRMTAATYPAVGGSSLGTYQYQYDNMGRLGSMTQYTNGTGWNTIANAAYSVANQMTSLSTAFTGTETRAYNSLLQLTRATVPGIMDMQYNYTAGQNNGRITSSQDYISRETVQYAYDSLLRLASAQTTGTQWGEAYAYDGFGNLTGKTPTKGSAPALSVSYNPATNQPYNGNYDANGNAPVGTWNVENKLVGQVLDGTQVNWSYDPFGERVARYTASGSWWSEWDGHWDFYLYGPTGQRMAQIGCDTISGQQIGESSSCVSEGTDVYFGGKLIAETDASGQVLAPTDRLGTVRGVNTNGTMAQPTYFPYGEPKTAGGIDRQQQFGTYVRDSTPSAQDYAGQRYYSNVTGRFFSPDPGGIATANPRNPGSWNRYAYVHGDPVNFMDTTGGIDALICGYEDDFGDDGCFDPGDDGGGGLPYCSDDGLGFAPNPFCYAPGPMPPATPTPPPPVDCFAQLKDRPVDDPGAAKVGAVHTFWWVQGDMDGQTVQYIISAGPTPPNQSGVRYLNVSVTPGSDNGKDNSGANTAWSSGLSTANCDGVDAMIMAALGLEISNNTIVYHYFAFLGFGGPNSNSVAHYPWSRQRSALTPQHPAEPGPGRCSEARNDAKVAVGRAGWSDAGSAGGQILGLVLDLRAGPTGR